MSDLREELLNKIMINLCNEGIENLPAIRGIIVKNIGDYEIIKKCTDIVVIDSNNINMVKMFLATKKTEGGSEQTMRTRFYIYRNFIRDINKPFDKIKTFDIRLWLAKEQQRVSLSTVESYRTAISSLFNWLYTEGMIPDNPMTNIKPIKHPNAIKKSFTSLEIDALKSSCKNKIERAVVELLLSSGLRCEELCNLKWCDINFSTKDISVIEGKGRKNRITLMDDVTRKYLIDYKESLDYDCEYVFGTRYKGTIKRRDESSVWLMLKNVGERAGIKESNPHKYRHTFATNLYKRGMDVRMIQQLLGHSNINTTMIYINTDTEMLQDAYKRCI